MVDTVSPLNPPGAGVQNNFVAIGAPTAANDSSQGYAVGSQWQNVSTGTRWMCRDATAGAAVWVRGDNSDFPGYVAGSGRWHNPTGPSQFVTGAVAAANLVRMYPIIIKERVAINALGLRVTTVSSGGNLMAGIYAMDPATKYATGTPLVNTGALSTGTATTVNAAVSYTFDAGFYWAATVLDNATAVCLGVNGLFCGQLIGSLTQNNVGAQGIVFSYAAGSFTLPDLTGVTPTEIVVNTTSPAPLIEFKLA